MSKAMPERRWPICGGACTVAPQTYSDTCPGTRGVNSRTSRVRVSWRRRVTGPRLRDRTYWPQRLFAGLGARPARGGRPVAGAPPGAMASICVGSLLIFAEYQELSPLSAELFRDRRRKDAGFTMNGFRHRAARVLGHVAVVIGILAVIAAAFALSYDAVRDIARAAGVPATLARIYPGILDAVFLVACAAALMLRDARWWGLKLPHRTTAGTIAALPWVLVMLAFSLWLSMLRHSRSAATAPSPE